MLNPDLFAAYILVSIVLILVPGPTVTLVVATGASRGVRPALLTVAGTAVANAILLGLIALGLTWLVNTSALVFEIVRWIGAAYLVWLGVQAWRQAGNAAPDADTRVARRAFWRGFWIALSNPKTIAFFTAFLPQFIDPALPAAMQTAIMCAAFVVMAAVLDSAYGIAAGMGRGLVLRAVPEKLLGRLSGVVLIAGGIWLALTRRPA